jgi:beta-glucosidase
MGLHAPGLSDREATLKAIHHVNLAHGKAISALRADDKDLTLGIINSLGPVLPLTDSEQDRRAADYMHALWNHAFAGPQFLGRYPVLVEPDIAPYLRADDLATIHQPLDYFGLNHYSPSYARHDPQAMFGSATLPVPNLSFPEGTPVTGMGWEISPRAFYDQLMDVHRRYGPVPIYVTENGAGYQEGISSDGRIHDDYRIAFLEQYLGALHQAIAAGADVRGYFIWSLLDNFEWACGYAKRFGLVYIDYRTLQRLPKDSFDYYRRMVAANAVVPAESV